MKKIIVACMMCILPLIGMATTAFAREGTVMTDTSISCTVTGAPGAGVFCSLTPDAGKTADLSSFTISWTAPTVTVDVHAIVYNVLPHGQMYTLHEVAGVSGSISGTFSPALEQGGNGNISASVSSVAMAPPNQAGAVTLTLNGTQD